jgi:putative acetyltransferase
MEAATHPPGIEVRLAVVDEAPTIAAVLHSAFLEYYPLYTTGGFAATTPTSDQIRQRWEEEPIWVALQDVAIVGTVAAVPRGEMLYVRSMAVLPAARGLGIGKLLMQYVEQFAVAQGHQRLLLSTTPFLTEAIGLYEHMGFQRTNDGPHELFGTPLLTMVKDMTPAPSNRRT